jgi:hypothetical protein
MRAGALARPSNASKRGYPLERMRTHGVGISEVERALRLLVGRGDPNAIHIGVTP